MQKTLITSIVFLFVLLSCKVKPTTESIEGKWKWKKMEFRDHRPKESFMDGEAWFIFKDGKFTQSQKTSGEIFESTGEYSVKKDEERGMILWLAEDPGFRPLIITKYTGSTMMLDDGLLVLTLERE